MKKLFIAFVAGALAMFPGKMNAQGLSLGTSTDVVSAFMWHGFKLGDAAIQPSVTLDFEPGNGDVCLEAGLWANAGLGNFSQELDAFVSAEFAGFTLGVTDYMSPVQDLADEMDNHCLDMTLGYTFDAVPVSLLWSSVVQSGDWGHYFEASYTYSVGDFLDLTATVGVIPFESDYYVNSGFELPRVSLDATLTSLPLPVSLGVSYNSMEKETYFTAGFSF